MLSEEIKGFEILLGGPSDEEDKAEDIQTLVLSLSNPARQQL